MHACDSVIKDLYRLAARKRGAFVVPGPGLYAGVRVLCDFIPGIPNFALKRVLSFAQCGMFIASSSPFLSALGSRM